MTDTNKEGYICPYCTSSHTIKQQYRDNKTKQRYLCKDCNKTFTVDLLTLEILTRVDGVTEKVKKTKKLFDEVEEITRDVVSYLEKRKRLSPTDNTVSILCDETWVQMFSDSHCGLKVTRGETGDIGNYNLEVFKKQLQYLLDTTVRILDYHTNTPDTLIIPFLGDLVENCIMRDNQMASVEFQVTEQVMHATEIILDYIIALSKYFKNIKCFGVYGNHGRLTQSIKGSHPSDNFDRLVYWALKARLAGIDNITFDYTEAQHMLVEIEGWNFWIEHGDTLRGWNGLPFYGAKREMDKINKMLMKYKENADYMLCGHFHNSAEFENIIMNGCWAGGDLFSIGKLRTSSIPSQTLFSVNKKHGVIWKRDIQLVDNIKDVKVRVYNT